RRASPACTASYAVVYGVGGIRNPWCEPGWTIEPVHVLTESRRRHEEGGEHGDRAVSSRLWVTLPPSVAESHHHSKPAHAHHGLIIRRPFAYPLAHQSQRDRVLIEEGRIVKWHASPTDP